jgi:hypothetical protein
MEFLSGQIGAPEGVVIIDRGEGERYSVAA